MTAYHPNPVPWHRGRLLGFDLETTGFSCDHDRIVTAALVHHEPDRPTQVVGRLINPGIDIPKQATAVHGITTAHARTHGEHPRAALNDIVSALTDACLLGIPIVGTNIVYDLTMLDRECRRHRIPPLGHGLKRIAPVIDVLVLDRRMDRDPARRRNLTALCEHYGISIGAAHTSAADALAACAVAVKLAETFPQLQIDLDQLTDLQTSWASKTLDWPVRAVKAMAGATA